MIKKFNNFINEELVKNPSLLRGYLIHMLKKIKEISNNLKIRYDKDHRVYYKLVISNIAVINSDKINKIIKYHKSELLKNAIQYQKNI